MRKHIRKATFIFIGLVLIIFGLIAMPLPVLPGFIFVILGVLIISLEYPTLARYLEKLSEKNEKFARGYKKAMGKLEKFFKIDNK